MKHVAFLALALFALALQVAAQTADFSGSWALIKTDGKVSAAHSGAAPPVPGGGTSPGRYPGGQSRVGGSTTTAGGASMPLPELGAPEHEGLRLKISQTPTAIKIEHRWFLYEKPRGFSQEFTLDGREVENESGSGGVMVTRSRWNKSTLIHEGTQQIMLGNREVDLLIREEFSLSRDGKVLTIKTRRATPLGQAETRQTFQKEPTGP
jgi:hypothetical protein